MKFLVSLLGLGIFGGGIFIGTLQQNLSNIKTEVDRLFEEIEKDIRRFSEENPIIEEDAKTIKEVPSSRKRRDSTNKGVEASQYTFNAWTNLWIGLLNSYVQSLFIKNKELIHKTLFMSV